MLTPALARVAACGGRAGMVRRVAESDPARLLGVLQAHSMRFVVISGAGDEGVAIAPSRHPTNLEALGGALEELGAGLRQDERLVGGAPRPVFGPAGRVTLSTAAGPLALYVGPEQPSLYAQVLQEAVVVELEGVTVRAAPFPAEVRDD